MPRARRGTGEHAGVALPLTGAQPGYSEDTAGISIVYARRADTVKAERSENLIECA